MKDLWGDIEQRAIEVIKAHTPAEGMYVAFSGGKDSIVVLDLVRRSGVKHDAWYNLTTIDPPELVHFIKREYPDVGWNRPKRTMWKLMETYGLPTRIGRFCCKKLKERGGDGRVVATGIRTAESPARGKRRQFEACRAGKGKWFLHPIKDWTDDDVWNYIKRHNLPYCRLYDEGWKRIGCVICPFDRDTRRSRERWPKYWAAAKRAAKKFYDRKPRSCSFETFWCNWLRRDGKLFTDETPEDERGTGLFV